MSNRIKPIPKDGIQLQLIRDLRGNPQESEDVTTEAEESTSQGNGGGSGSPLYQPTGNGLEKTFLGKQYVLEVPEKKSVLTQPETTVDYQREWEDYVNSNSPEVSFVKAYNDYVNSNNWKTLASNPVPFFDAMGMNPKKYQLLPGLEDSPWWERDEISSPYYNQRYTAPLKEESDSKFYMRDRNGEEVEISKQEIPAGTVVSTGSKELIKDEKGNLVEFTWEGLSPAESLIYGNLSLVKDVDIYPSGSVRAIGKDGNPIKVNSYEVFKDKEHREEYRNNVGEGFVKALQAIPKYARGFQKISSPETSPVYIPDMSENEKSIVDYSWVVKEAWKCLPDEKKEEILRLFGKSKKE